MSPYRNPAVDLDDTEKLLSVLKRAAWEHYDGHWVHAKIGKCEVRVDRGGRVRVRRRKLFFQDNWTQIGNFGEDLYKELCRIEVESDKEKGIALVLQNACLKDKNE
jgi:hypothetical protein